MEHICRTALFERFLDIRKGFAKEFDKIIAIHVIIENLTIIEHIICVTFRTDINVIRWISDNKVDCFTIKYFVETTFNYPTMAEAYRVATLNGMNRLF